MKKTLLIFISVLLTCVSLAFAQGPGGFTDPAVDAGFAGPGSAYPYESDIAGSGATCTACAACPIPDWYMNDVDLCGDLPGDDSDQDGCTNLEEYYNYADPENPGADTDCLCTDDGICADALNAPEWCAGYNCDARGWYECCGDQYYVEGDPECAIRFVCYDYSENCVEPGTCIEGCCTAADCGTAEEWACINHNPIGAQCSGGTTGFGVCDYLGPQQQQDDDPVIPEFTTTGLLIIILVFLVSLLIIKKSKK